MHDQDLLHRQNLLVLRVKVDMCFASASNNFIFFLFLNYLFYHLSCIYKTY